MAGTYYVDASAGNDTNTGLSPDAAKKTIGAALGHYRIINLAPGFYRETVDLGGIYGLRLLGVPTDGYGQVGSCIVAPNATTSAIKSSGLSGQNEIAYLTTLGSTVASANSYTGTVFDATNMSIGTNVHDVQIVGIHADFDHSKQYVGTGSGNGGIGLVCSNAEQTQFDNIYINNCSVGVKMIQGSTLSKLDLAHFHVGQCFIAYQGYGGGDCTYRVWKMQNIYGLAYAAAHLTSDGSNPADGDTVKVRDQTYRFKTSPVQANDIQIGPAIDATLLSLVHAVNGTGTSGGDYFAGTAKPTGVKAGWMNLVDYGATGGNGFFYDAIDTTRHACTFQIQDMVGPAGNAFPFTVTSAHLFDYFGKAAFARAAWGFEIQYPATWESLDAMENISLPAANAMLISGSGSIFTWFKTAPQTQLSITGNHNYFLLPQFQNACTTQTGAKSNEFHKPFSTGDSRIATSATRITDHGTGTVITL